MKKLLALVLALVMSMSLVTISNAAFKDADKIDYKEAVDVMNAVGVFIGDEKGNFNAKENLTREQAAKIIAYLELGSKAADALVGSNIFSDVAATRWSAGFVGYCAQAGVVAGVGDSKFDPAGQLTALQFGKMLLVELGYDAKAAGMVGADWAINTSKLMAKAKLMDGIDGSVNQVLTREKAAQMCLNALEAPTVEYTTKGSSISVNGAEINLGASEPSYVTNTIAKEQTISSEKLTNNGGYTIELGEKLYKNLKKISTTDDFGRPANTWRFKGVEVGTFAKTADATYTADVKLGQIYSDLGMSDKDEAAPVFVDGVEASESAKVSKGNDLKVSELKFTNSPVAKCNVGNGTLVEAYLDEDTNDVTIVAINTYVAEVNKVVAKTNSKDAYITLSELAAENGATSGLRANDEFETTGFENDQIVLFTYANNEIQSVKAAESAEGTLTRKVSGKSINLGETKYDFSKMYSVDGGESSLGIDSEYVVYLDANGYAIYVEETEYNIADYAYLRALQGSSVAFASDKAALITYDGKMKTVDTKEDYTNDFAGYGSELQIGNANSEIVLVKETSNGEIGRAHV